MKTKLPDGVPVVLCKGEILWGKTPICASCREGTAYTFEQLAERDKAIAREAFLSGRSIGNIMENVSIILSISSLIISLFIILDNN